MTNGSVPGSGAVPRIPSEAQIRKPALTYAYPDGSIAADGVVLEVDPPNRVTMLFHARWDKDIEAEGPVEMAWVLEARGDSTKLTVTTSGLIEGSRTAADFSAGIVYIVSGLKTLVETGRPLAAGAAG